MRNEFMEDDAWSRKIRGFNQWFVAIAAYATTFLAATWASPRSGGIFTGTPSRAKLATDHVQRCPEHDDHVRSGRGRLRVA
jgi:hypothetical protein